MSWTESETEHFHCRHASAGTVDAARVLALLERTRDRLKAHFPRLGDGPTVVLHETPASLALSNPFMSLNWAASAPAARRYVTGWTGRRELHVLTPDALRERSSGVTGSFEMLALAPASLYVRHILFIANQSLRELRAPTRSITELRLAWLLDGTSRWFSGESSYARVAISHLMRGGHRPHFPPTARHAPLIAAPLVDLLAQRHGEEAVVRLATRLHPGSSRAALDKAFSGRSLVTVESDWRSELRRLAEGR